jgi:hypothetical protein
MCACFVNIFHIHYTNVVCSLFNSFTMFRTSFVQVLYEFGPKYFARLLYNYCMNIVPILIAYNCCTFPSPGCIGAGGCRWYRTGTGWVTPWSFSSYTMNPSGSYFHRRGCLPSCRTPFNSSVSRLSRKGPCKPRVKLKGQGLYVARVNFTYSPARPFGIKCT